MMKLGLQAQLELLKAMAAQAGGKDALLKRIATELPGVRRISPPGLPPRMTVDNVGPFGKTANDAVAAAEAKRARKNAKRLREMQARESK